MGGSCFYWQNDGVKLFWQLVLDPLSRWLFCFATPFGVKQYNRVPMGAKTAPMHTDECMSKCLDDAGLH